METPSSMRRITRSQASKQERPSTNAERSALLDITNDSPIVGLALSVPSEKTPSSSAVKKHVALAKNAGTPGSGEALLRCQVRTLLQKVEEDGELMVSRLPSGESRPAFRVLLGLPGPSPIPVQILAPTPANTPQIAGHSASAAVPMDAVEEVCVETDTPQAGLKEEEETSDAPECLINRALLFDSPGKSEASDCAAASTISSSLTYQGSEISCEKSPVDDDSSSAWSLQVNMSSHHDDDGQEEEEEGDFEEEEEEYDEEEEDECFDDLCEGLSKMSMNGEKAGLPEFTGTHTRFVYSDENDEVIEREEEVVKESISPSAVLLKGLPVPKGKHLRFRDEEYE